MSLTVIDDAAMGDGNYNYDETAILDSADDAMVPNPIAP
jgi:hypothetical protein